MPIFSARSPRACARLWAKEWRLIDATRAKPQQSAATVRKRALEPAELSDRPAMEAQGVKLDPIARQVDERGYHYSTVDVQVDPAARTATLTISAPIDAQPNSLPGHPGGRN